MKKDVKVIAYYFPNYHIDEHNQKVHGEGWTEWELMKKATPKFEGHHQPRIPLWGYEDEADPKVMERKICEAKKYGVDCFLFDAYFYEEEEFLHRCLNEGFLKAENTNDMEFALMWANHTWTNIHPASLDKESEVEFRGEVSEEAFKRITRKIINTYFTCKNYMRVDGKPYFSIYAISSLLNVFKSVEKINQLLKEFREDARKVVGEIHINAVIGELSLLPGEDIEMGFPLLNQLDVDSYSSYCWLHHYHMEGHFPTDEYDNAANYYLKGLPTILDEATKPYYPNVSMGWDASPRTNPDGPFVKANYPYTPILVGNTPEKFGKYLREVANFAKETLDEPMIVINAWNEWTEGSYIEPDTINGYGYLEEIKKLKEML